jgi:HEAT repeat protein
VTGNGASWDRLAALEDLYYNKHDPQTVVPLLIKLLGDSDSGIRVRAIQYLVDNGDRRAIAPLIALFDGASDESHARDAGQMLAKFGADAVPVFLSRLSSPKPYVRGAAAAGLGWVWWDTETGETKTDRAAAKAAITDNALGPLIPMLRDPDAGVRGYVANAMGNIRDKRFLAPLVAVLAAQTDTDLEIFSRVISYYRGPAWRRHCLILARSRWKMPPRRGPRTTAIR